MNGRDSYVRKNEISYKYKQTAKKVEEEINKYLEKTLHNFCFEINSDCSTYDTACKNAKANATLKK